MPHESGQGLSRLGIFDEAHRIFFDQTQNQQIAIKAAQRAKVSSDRPSYDAVVHTPNNPAAHQVGVDRLPSQRSLLADIKRLKALQDVAIFHDRERRIAFVARQVGQKAPG